MAALEAETVPSLPPSVVLPNELNNRQKLFVTYYIETRNGTKSAKLAGYEGDDNSLKVTASRLLTNANVQSALDSYFQSRILSANGVLSELSSMAFAPLADMEARQGENGQLIPAVLRPADKIKSLELVGKFHRLFADRTESELTLTDADADRIGQSVVNSLLEAAQRRRQQQQAQQLQAAPEQ
jgi:phage terminase small subunit